MKSSLGMLQRFALHKSHGKEKRDYQLSVHLYDLSQASQSAIPQKGSEVNLTLGGIDLNNSGSVVVKVDKKLLTVLFPDGRDGQAFTLKIFPE